ncbi:hypothetical protein [Phenylobacterium sp.]|jgi:hypothetical protein|uniref:hypothetical protein n=1 Tax=Phenylobacterium sp. TaxID=1871053 RepID=UPI002F92A023
MVTSAREIRPLPALHSAGSTSRVLNLTAVWERDAAEPDYSARPFFSSPLLNTAIIVKHKIRADERDLFDGAPTSATKIIIPFHTSELGLGARAMFVGQRGWQAMLLDLCRGPAEFQRDRRVVELLNALPSLDPFLLREHFKTHQIDIAPCYFAISEADCRRMQAFVGEEIGRLIELAYANKRDSGDEAAKLVKILLSTQIDERLEPLRLTLNLEGDAYREGVFSWKGFLYYKWMLSELWPRLGAVVAELQQIRSRGLGELELSIYLDGAVQRLARAIAVHRAEVLEALSLYDHAFADLTEGGRTAPFRDFLIKAPTMFTMLGERIGAISHIASFWRYRFPDGCAHGIPALELVEIVQDFEASLGVLQRQPNIAAGEAADPTLELGEAQRRIA